ncbi:hypothetical protein KAR10_09340 [bacterium]|nr:hypothetical protein [bacterium]
MNSHRDVLKDMLKNRHRDDYSNSGCDEDVLNADMANEVDAIFECLGITEDEQDRCGGYFLLHASKNSDGVAMPPPAVDKIITALRELEKSVGVEYITPRKEELKNGSKYQSWEFKAFAEGRQRFEDNKSAGWFVSLRTPICYYAQAFDCDDLDVCKAKFTNAYYPMYLTDYERSQELAKVDSQ